MGHEYSKEDIERFKRTWLGKKLVSWGFDFIESYTRYKRPKETFSGAGIFKDQNGQSRLGGNSIYKYWRDGKGALFGVLIFALFWNGITGTIFYMVFSGGPVTVNNRTFENIYVAFEHNPWVLVFLVFPLIGISFFYFAVAMAVNKTTYSVNHHSINVKHGPLPSPGNRTVSRADIKQLYVVQKVLKNKNGTQVRYKLMMQSNRSNKPIQIAGPFNSYKNARILEQWFETKLGLTDEIVKGEVS